MRDHPITPVTEPMQYRAIGLVRGVYSPEAFDQFTRGFLIDEQGMKIEAVVLGRVLALMKRHLNMEEPHLWVVYPRSRKSNKLHLQIAGIWEPSTLNVNDKEESHSQKENINKSLILEDQLKEGDDYFSIRGELIFTKQETKDLIIKIRQKPRKSVRKPFPFKIHLKGDIPLKNLHDFISLDVRRIGQDLKVEDYQIINAMKNHSSKKFDKNKLSKKESI